MHTHLYDKHLRYPILINMFIQIGHLRYMPYAIQFSQLCTNI